MSSSFVFLTPEEVAHLLRIDTAQVLMLLNQGSLAGMPIAGDWRVRADSVEDFLAHGLQRENLRALGAALEDPAHWKRVMLDFPDLTTSIEQGEYPSNSFGAFLKDAPMQKDAANEGRQTMGKIVLYHGTGAQDFEIAGPTWTPIEAKRVFLNARRLLIIRGQTEAVELLDSAPFGVFPATNNFNDEFYALCAELPLPDYENFRRTETDKRHAAKLLAETIAETSGPYIRFVAIRLRLADPEVWDVFLCHASEDKESVARPVFAHLASSGIACWIDEAEIAWGESIVAKIQEGLARARYVIVILSPQFVRKPWAQKELRTALTLEIDADRNLVLPLVVGEPQSVLASLPFLREKRYLSWTGDAGDVERELRTLAQRHTP